MLTSYTLLLTASPTQSREYKNDEPVNIKRGIFVIVLSKTVMNIDYHKKMTSDIFFTAIKEIDPYSLVVLFKEKVRAAYQRVHAKKLLIIGFGKASVAMGHAAEDSLYDIITEGVLITKHGHTNKSLPLRKLKVLEAGHPIPDEYGYAGTAEVLRLLQKADENTLVLCLISGGGSALLVSPCAGITLAEKQEVSELLLRVGADISELNTVRKHISAVKGGRLAELACPARTISLILSDVIGDRLDVIASGPTAPDKTTFTDAHEVLRKYRLLDRVPESVRRVIADGIKGHIPDTPKEGDPLFSFVENIIIGSNRIALNAAKQEAEEFGFGAEIISSDLQGEAREVGKWLAEKAKDIRKAVKQGGRATRCLISGGETTVTVKGKGLGGRNMELALAFAIEIDGIDGITFLSAGTDGTDGPTDATGAIVDGKTVETARIAGLDPDKYLNNNDSYNFFKKVDGLLITGPTGTNVMDVQIILIDL
ncbi:MAG: glycerate kinase [Thermodesulfovibrionales bacterium]